MAGMVSARLAYRRNMRLEHDDIADKLDTITLRIQGKLSDPPSGKVLWATDWGEAGSWMDNMVNYVRNVLSRGQL